ncbi:dihydrodipicolinate reductase [Candidatus Bipolaricaulota bacterium]|nr:dihydrodipicolinate reductase [Candidatus Bipolaricaulota bacterium]
MKIKVVQFGLGKIGKEISKLVLNRDRFELVGAVEKDREKVGRDPAELLNLTNPSGITVTDNPGEALAEKPDLAFHSTASRVSEVHKQLKHILERGTNVISTSEELTYPHLQAQERADELDGIAKENGVTIFGTGVNPGFVMDLLPLTFSGVARTLEKITVKRVQNASVRRKALQSKIGVGLSEEEFDEKVRQKGGHVGLIESLSLVSTGLGWKLDEIEERTDPVITGEKIETEYFKVKPGESLGIDQTAIGTMAGEEKIKLNLQIFAGASNPVDEVSLRGVPEVRIKVPGGIHGDIATPAIAVNSSQKVLQESPGLLTLLDIYPYLYNFEQ